jgi:hypothetical protein
MMGGRARARARTPAWQADAGPKRRRSLDLASRIVTRFARTLREAMRGGEFRPSSLPQRQRAIPGANSLDPCHAPVWLLTDPDRRFGRRRRGRARAIGLTCSRIERRRARTLIGYIQYHTARAPMQHPEPTDGRMRTWQPREAERRRAWRPRSTDGKGSLIHKPFDYHYGALLPDRPLAVLRNLAISSVRERAARTLL